MSVTKRVFDTDKKTGKTVYEYTLENANGMKAKFINYGAILTELWVKDAEGVLADVVLYFYILVKATF